MAWKFPPQELKRLIRPQRYRRSPPFKTLRRMRLRRGMDVVDIGCGPGFWSLPAARIVGPQARVLACDVSLKMLAVARQRAEEEGIANVTFKRSREYRVPFPDGCADFCIMNYVLHEVDEPERLLAEGVRVLRPGGLLAVYEWAKRKTRIGPPLADRVPQSRMETLFRAAGLRRGFKWRPDPDNYILVGVRP